MEKEREKKALKMYADLSEFIFLFIHSLIYLYTYFLLFSYILIVQSKIATTYFMGCYNICHGNLGLFHHACI